MKWIERNWQHGTDNGMGNKKRHRWNVITEVLVKRQKLGTKALGCFILLCLPSNHCLSEQSLGSLEGSGSLNVQLRPQETDMWCWAASGEMIMEFLGTHVSQCEQASKEFNCPDCCVQDVPEACVNGGFPQFDSYGFKCHSTVDSPLSWENVQDQISNKRTPFAFSWHKDGGGHMMVVTGCFAVSGTNYVEVHDPWPPDIGDHYTLTYSNFVSGDNYSHWDDYYDVSR